MFLIYNHCTHGASSSINLIQITHEKQYAFLCQLHSLYLHFAHLEICNPVLNLQKRAKINVLEQLWTLVVDLHFLELYCRVSKCFQSIGRHLY